MACSVQKPLDKAEQGRWAQQREDGWVRVPKLEARDAGVKGPSGVRGPLGSGAIGYCGDRRVRRVHAHMGDGGGILEPKQSEGATQATGDWSPPGGLIPQVNT